MAIITMGAVITAVRGSVGGVVFSANKAGPHAKIGYRSTNPKTGVQRLTRARASIAGRNWTALTSGQRTGWNALSAAPPEVLYNSLGKITVISGFQWFAKITCRQYAIGATISTTAPAGSAPAAAASLTAAISTTTATVTYTAGYFAANEYLVILLAAKFKAGANVASSGYRLSGYTLSPPNSTFSFFTQLQAVYGSPVAGQKMFIRFAKQLLNGLRSPALSVVVTVT